MEVLIAIVGICLAAVTATSDKEEEIRIAVEKQLAFIEDEAEITLEGKE